MNHVKPNIRIEKLKNKMIPISTKQYTVVMYYTYTFNEMKEKNKKIMRKTCSKTSPARKPPINRLQKLYKNFYCFWFLSFVFAYSTHDRPSACKFKLIELPISALLSNCAQAEENFGNVRFTSRTKSIFCFWKALFVEMQTIRVA